MSGSGISWAICKSAPHSIQITMPATHHSVFTGRMPFLPPNRVKALKGIKVTQVTANHCGRQARGGEYYRLAINISGVKLFFCKTKPQSSYAHSVPFKIHVVIRLKWWLSDPWCLFRVYSGLDTKLTEILIRIRSNTRNSLYLRCILQKFVNFYVFLIFYVWWGFNIYVDISSFEAFWTFAVLSSLTSPRSGLRWTCPPNCC